MSENIKQKIFREFKEFLYITLTTAVGSFGWCAFLLPHKIPIGGISGLASVIFWGIDIPIEYTYFILNIILLLVALKVLGWRFCIRTIYTVFIFATLLTLFQRIFSAAPLLPTNPQMGKRKIRLRSSVRNDFRCRLCSKRNEWLGTILHRI